MAIIAILASILFPVFASARDRARQTTCTSNLKQIYSAFRMYAQDYDGRYPDNAVLGDSAYRYADDPRSMPAILDPYIKNEDVWYCPGQKQAFKDARMPGYFWTKTNTQLRAPDAFENDDAAVSNAILFDNYPYKVPSAPGSVGVAPTQWTSAEGKWCAHVGRTNFNNLWFDGHVKLYNAKTATALCKKQAS